MARNYHPFGAYHLMIGSHVRTIRTASALAASPPQTRLGNAAYAEEVTRQLNMNRLWKSVYATSGR